MEALEAAAGEVSKEEILKLFQAQRDAFHAELPVSYEARMDRINRTARMIVENKDALCDAVSSDFGHRSSVQTVMTDQWPGGISAQGRGRRDRAVELPDQPRF